MRHNLCAFVVLVCLTAIVLIIFANLMGLPIGFWVGR